ALCTVTIKSAIKRRRFCIPKWNGSGAVEHSRTVTSQRDSIILLVLLALFLALVMFAQHFAIRVDLDAPFLAILVDDGFVVRALFFPANDFSALGLLLSGFLHRVRNVRTADGFLFVFLF